MEDDLAKNRRFLQEAEQIIRTTNNQIIHEEIPPINTERMISFATVIAKLRAQYIDAAFKCTGGETGSTVASSDQIEELRKCRVQFEEARDAFIALQRAIELGYVIVE